MRLGSALLPLALAAVVLAIALHAARRPAVNAAHGVAGGGVVDGGGQGEAGSADGLAQPAGAPGVFPGWVGARDGETGEAAAEADAAAIPAALEPTADAPDPLAEPAVLAAAPAAVEPAAPAAPASSDASATPATPATSTDAASPAIAATQAPADAPATPIADVRPPPSALLAGLRVRVAEPDGTAVEGAWLALEGPDGARATARTDATGLAHVAELAPGAWDVALLSPGLRQGPAAFELHDATANATATPAPGETREIALLAPPRARLTGRLALAGRPLGGAELALVDRVAAPGGDELPSNAVHVRCASGGDGRFELPPVPPGAYRLEVRHADLGSAVGTVSGGHARELALAEGRTALDLELEPAEVAGRVLGPDGAALRGAVLWLESPAQAHCVARDGEGFFAATDGEPVRVAVDAIAWASSDGDGFYLLDGVLPVAGLRLLVEAPGAKPLELPLELTPGTTRRLDVRLERGASLDVVLVDASGAPQPGAWLVAEGSDGRARWALTDAHGAARWPSLAPGAVRVTGALGLAVERTLELAPAERAELVLARP